LPFAEIESALKIILDETAAYHAHFSNVDVNQLINTPTNDKI
jgi:hypothetical protein